MLVYDIFVVLVLAAYKNGEWLDAGCWVLGTKYWVLDTRYWILANCYWSLAVR